MIAYLRGKIIFKEADFLILEVNDVGYKIYCLASFLEDVVLGQALELHTYQYIREDAMDLFGFTNLEELEIFKKLNSVAGIGPKTALGVLAVSSPQEIFEAVGRNDPSLLTKVSGIGKKTAERIVLELKGKMPKVLQIADEGSGNAEVIEALMGLGYKIKDARDAVRKIPKTAQDTTSKVKAALKLLGKK